MGVVVMAVFVASWLWSVVLGVRVSVLRGLLNLLLPPLAQLYFAVRQKNLRIPLFLMVASLVYLFLIGKNISIDITFD
ncbi:hypothetical protein [Haliea sp. E17]|uniref:hypothetical protein n=1 Tax=Haliea sp. E17 TaxID=3401576 RepID=UPI003AACD0B6